MCCAARPRLILPSWDKFWTCWPLTTWNKLDGTIRLRLSRQLCYIPVVTELSQAWQRKKTVRGSWTGFLFPFPSPNFDWIPVSKSTDSIVSVVVLLKPWSHFHFLMCYCWWIPAQSTWNPISQPKLSKSKFPFYQGPPVTVSFYNDCYRSPGCQDNIVTSLKIPSSLLQVVYSLFLLSSSANTNCWQHWKLGDYYGFYTMLLFFDFYRGSIV